MEVIEIIGCRRCGELFAICLKCYRGQVYCQPECRQAALKEQHRRAQANYLATENGQERRAAAVAAFRERARHGAPPAHPWRSINWHEPTCNRSRSSNRSPSVSSWSTTARCSRRGRLGRVLTPFRG